jgi:hypothetical protein
MEELALKQIDAGSRGVNNDKFTTDKVDSK